jgi:hypothetical protein
MQVLSILPILLSSPGLWAGESILAHFFSPRKHMASCHQNMYCKSQNTLGAKYWCKTFLLFPRPHWTHANHTRRSVERILTAPAFDIKGSQEGYVVIWALLQWQQWAAKFKRACRPFHRPPISMSQQYPDCNQAGLVLIKLSTCPFRADITASMSAVADDPKKKAMSTLIERHYAMSPGHPDWNHFAAPHPTVNYAK